MVNNLLDTWRVSGTSKDELFKELKKLTSVTHMLECRSDNIQLMTVQDVEGGSLNGYLHLKGNILNKGIPVDALEKIGVTPELLDETTNSSHLLLCVGNEVFFTTKRVLKTLSQRAGSGMGDFALREELKIRFYRDGGYVAYMEAIPAGCKVLYRQYGKIRKIYAVFSERYAMIPQYPLIKELISGFEAEMGESEILGYSVDHFGTDILLEFPKKASDFSLMYGCPETVMPGLHIHISDVGDSSFIIHGTARVKSSVVYIPAASYARAHTKNAETSEILEIVSKTIFVEYTKFPERLVQLLSIDISKPKELISKIVKHCNIRKELGVKLEKEITENLEQAINPNLEYTAYDIAMMFLDLSADLEEGKSEQMKNKVRSVLADAVFFKYEA